jgi:hypothetical protein
MGWGFGDIVKTVATGGLNKVADNKNVAKAVDKLTKPVGSRVTAVAKAMRLPSIATNLNIKKAITDPVGYAKDNAAAYAKDATVAASIYTNLKKGNVKGIITQGLSDTKAAAKAAATGKTQANEWKLDQPVIPSPIEQTPTYSQLTGDIQTNQQPSMMPAPTEYVGQNSGGMTMKTKLLIVGAVAVVLVLVATVAK